MTDVQLDLTKFRTRFPAFASDTDFPDDYIQMFWENAACYVSTADYGRLAGNCRQMAVMLMTAHLMASQELIDVGESNLVLNNSRIDNISISVRPPPSKNQWQWFLNTTPYGTQLFSLLQVRSVGGLIVGGSPERSAFRKVGGGF